RIRAAARVEDIVARDGIVQFVAGEDIQRSLGLHGRIVEDEAIPQAQADLLAVDVDYLHARFDHGAAGRILVRDAALPEHVAKDVERPHGGRGRRDVDEAVVDVVAPDPDIHVGAFALDAVIPAV